MNFYGDNTSQPPFDASMKILLLGDSCVGKTCLLNRYVQDTFSSDFITTIGIDYRLKFITVDNVACRLEIWDTAGQERFRAITKMYLRNVDGTLLVFDITNRESYEHVELWMKQITEVGGDKVSVVLVGTHADMSGSRAVTRDEISKISKNLKTDYFETSSRQNIYVDDAFQCLVKKILSSNPGSMSHDKFFHASDLDDTVTRKQMNAKLLAEHRKKSNCCNNGE